MLEHVPENIYLNLEKLTIYDGEEKSSELLSYIIVVGMKTFVMIINFETVQ